MSPDHKAFFFVSPTIYMMHIRGFQGELGGGGSVVATSLGYDQTYQIFSFSGQNIDFGSFSGPI